MAVTVTPMSPACGAEISGVDLRQPLSDDDVATIYRAWLDHLVMGTPTGHTTIQEGRLTVEVTLAIEESSRTGLPVAISKG